MCRKLSSVLLTISSFLFHTHARAPQEFDVVERKFTIHEVTDAIKEGRMIESFGAGTAAVVSPVQLIHFAGTDYKVCLHALYLASFV